MNADSIDVYVRVGITYKGDPLSYKAGDPLVRRFDGMSAQGVAFSPEGEYIFDTGESAIRNFAYYLKRTLSELGIAKTPRLVGNPIPENLRDKVKTFLFADYTPTEEQIEALNHDLQMSLEELDHRLRFD